jgi:hypothetical protein
MHDPDRACRRLVQTAIGTAAAIALPALGQGQAFPSRPIRLICSTDAVMRALAESAGKTLGGQFVVENKPGASGIYRTWSPTARPIRANSPSVHPASERPPSGGAQRLHGLGTARRCRHRSPARHLRRQANQALAQRADIAGVGF